MKDKFAGFLKVAAAAGVGLLAGRYLFPKQHSAWDEDDWDGCDGGTGCGCDGKWHGCCKGSNPPDDLDIVDLDEEE